MILLAFLFPLAIYLLVLGVINRRRHPLLVSGVWDGIGLLFAVSGFLLFAGPAVFSSLSERWRMYWLLGQARGPVLHPDGAWQLWVFLSIGYFVLIVVGAAFYFWRQRRLTSIYHVEAAQVERAVARTCERLGVNPVRSGGMFLFGLPQGVRSEWRGGNGERIQSPHYLPAAVRASGQEAAEVSPRLAPGPLPPDTTVLEQTAILELDPFPLMNHVTLRWDPADSPLRQLIESELAHQLAETPAPESGLGIGLLSCGFLLLTATFLGAFLLILINFLHR